MLFRCLASLREITRSESRGVAGWLARKSLRIASVILFLAIGILTYSSAERKAVDCPGEIWTTGALNDTNATTTIVLARGRVVFAERNADGAVCAEHLSYIDAMYMTVVTISTVGYGDFSPSTDGLRWFTMAYILVGCTYVFAFLSDIFTSVLSAYRECVLSCIDRFDRTAKHVGEDTSGDGKIDHKFAVSGRVKGLSGKAIDLTGDGQADFIAPPRAAVFWFQELIPSVLLWLLVQLVSAAIFCVCQDTLSFFEAFYHCFITATTVGYGDVRLDTQEARAWASAHILVSVSWLAALFGQIEESSAVRKGSLQRFKLLTSAMTTQKERDDIMAMDEDGKGVDKCEFVVGMLRLLGVELCGEPLRFDDVLPFMKKFEELDVSETGRITKADLDAFFQQQLAFKKHQEQRRNPNANETPTAKLQAAGATALEAVGASATAKGGGDGGSNAFAGLVRQASRRSEDRQEGDGQQLPQPVLLPKPTEASMGAPSAEEPAEATVQQV